MLILKLVFRGCIGDNDSCSIAFIQNVINYEIVKQSDMNHTTKDVGNTLHEIHNSKASDPVRDLSNDTIKHLQRCFTYAVKQNQGDISKIQAALKNIPYHIFSYHENCSQWCQNNINKENYTGCIYLRAINRARRSVYILANTLYMELNRRLPNINRQKQATRITGLRFRRKTGRIVRTLEEDTCNTYAIEIQSTLKL